MITEARLLCSRAETPGTLRTTAAGGNEFRRQLDQQELLLVFATSIARV
jgi:hypothetical protein